MKRKKLTLIALLSLIVLMMQAQTKTVELPPVTFANSRTLEIRKVILSDTATILHVEAFFRPGYWIKVVSDSYLNANGERFMIRSGEGIDLDSLFWMPKSGEASFKLVFEPLPKNTKSFDFIESDCEDCFKIYGIDLVNNRLLIPEIPREFTQSYQPEPDFKLEWHRGAATVSGQLLGHIPGTSNWTLIYLNPISGIEDAVPVEIADNGIFRTSITVCSPTNLYLRSSFSNIPIKVAPGKESKILVNLPELYREGSRLFKDQEPYGKTISYAGYLASLNNDLTNKNISYAMQSDYTDSIVGMNVNDYKKFMMEKFTGSVSHNNALDISPIAKRLVNAMEAFLLQNNLSSVDWVFMQAYAKQHDISLEEASKVFKPEVKASDFTDYYQFVPFNDIVVLLLPDISYYVRSLSNARKNMSDPYIILRYLSQHNEVSEEDRHFFAEYISAQEKNEKFEGSTLIESVFNKYQTLVDEYMKNQMGEGFLAEIWNTKDALLLDLIKARKMSQGIEDYTPLTNEQKLELSTYPEVIRQTLLEVNEALLARIEENKKKSGYRVLDTPEGEKQVLFKEMLKPFQGKVVLVDMWATWCGPCRMANKEMEPLKAQLANEKDLAYLYLAGENSPENTWKNMIVDLKGDHYRVNEDQWNYLCESLNANGVPTYLIIDKEGNQSFHHIGFPGSDTMKRELLKALKK